MVATLTTVDSGLQVSGTEQVRKCLRENCTDYSDTVHRLHEVFTLGVLVAEIVRYESIDGF